MFTWEDPKDPAELKDYSFDWTTDLGTDTIASCSAALVAGYDSGLTIVDGTTFSGKLSKVIVSGGIEGFALIKGHILTTAGNHHYDTGKLIIAASETLTSTPTDLAADLATLKSARLELLTTGKIKEVWRDGRRITYNVASVADLERAIATYEGYITDAQTAAGTANKRFRALSVRF